MCVQNAALNTVMRKKRTKDKKFSKKFKEGEDNFGIVDQGTGTSDFSV